MQKSVHLSSHSLRAALLFACANLLPLLCSERLHCDPYASAWVEGPKSSLRLIAAGYAQSQGVYRAGVEIRLEPDALTFWRTPGGAGVPPVFSFEGSSNAADIAVSYPAPRRFNEEGTEVFGYRGRVIFPLRVAAKDFRRPVLLVLNLAYAVCSKICIPARGEARLTLLPGKGDWSAAGDGETAALAAAEASVPRRLTPEQRDAKVAIARDETAASPAWRLSSRGGRIQDLFVEAQPGWYFEARKTRPDEFLIVELERPEKGVSPHPQASLTMTSEGQSYEFAAELYATPVASATDVRMPSPEPSRSGQD